ncbi:MAG: hypothetical protein GY749_38515 [Desulfobacteraceae bacterium]|nr:hypothetical protein [Desulfobacteraceae bacterium]
MSSKHHYQVRLVSPDVWHGIIEESFRGLDIRQNRLAVSLIKTMHNRHVGITPALAAELAPVLLDFRVQAGRVWSKVFDRLIDEVSVVKDSEKKSRFTHKHRPFGILPGINPVYTVFRLAMPVIEYACRLIHNCYLFCEDNISSSVPRSDYKLYSKALADQIILLAQGRDENTGSFDLFWKGRAATLSSFSRQFTGSGQTDFKLPESEPTALAFLLRLEPDMADSKQDMQRLQRQTSPLKHRKIHKLKQEGVDGIHITRRDDDLNNILLSEFINDELLLTDRLINTGYFAIQREPKREKLRDVLVAAVVPGYFQNSLNMDFVKACWFDALMRFSLVLRGKEMLKSQFRWIEGDRFGHARTCDFLLEHMYSFKSVNDKATEAYRSEFLSALRWLPSYLDTREHFSSVMKDAFSPGSGDDESDKTRIQVIKNWCFSAWSEQKKASKDKRKRTFSKHGTVPCFDFDEFSFIHIMMFLPVDMLDDEKNFMEESNLGPVFRGFGIGNYAGRNVSITWIPDKPDNIEKWAFAARGRPCSSLFPEQEDASERKIAGKLEKTWFNQWIKEIWLE